MSAQEPGTKLGAMLTKVDDLFRLIPGGGAGDNMMLGMLMPVLKEGLQLIARRVEKLPPEQIEQGQRLFGRALSTLADGLEDPGMSTADYLARLEHNLTELVREAKLPIAV